MYTLVYVVVKFMGTMSKLLDVWTSARKAYMTQCIAIFLASHFVLIAGRFLSLVLFLPACFVLVFMTRELETLVRGWFADVAVSPEVCDVFAIGVVPMESVMMPAYLA